MKPDRIEGDYAKVVRIIGDIGGLGMDLKRHDAATITASVEFMRKGNPELFDWLSQILTAGAPHEPSTTETKEAKLIAALRLTRTRDEHSLGCRIKDCTECHRLLDAVVEARCEALGDMLNPVAAVARPVEETKP